MRLRLRVKRTASGGETTRSQSTNLRRTPATRFDFAMLADNPSRLVPPGSLALTACRPAPHIRRTTRYHLLRKSQCQPRASDKRYISNGRTEER